MENSLPEVIMKVNLTRRPIPSHFRVRPIREVRMMVALLVALFLSKE
jgi:hypothetical protein